MQWYIFVELIGFLGVSCIQGCFYWLSSAIRSGIMPDYIFAVHYRGRRGR